MCADTHQRALSFLLLTRQIPDLRSEWPTCPDETPSQLQGPLCLVSAADALPSHPQMAAWVSAAAFPAALFGAPPHLQSHEAASAHGEKTRGSALLRLGPWAPGSWASGPAGGS